MDASKMCISKIDQTTVSSIQLQFHKTKISYNVFHNYNIKKKIHTALLLISLKLLIT